MDVVGGEVGQALAGVDARAELGAVDVLRARAAVGDVDELVRRDEARQAVVAVVLGQLGEGLGGGVVQPDIAVVGAGVAAAAPWRGAALEQHLRAVGRGVGRAAEGVVQADGRAALDRHHEGPRRAVEVALDRAFDEGDGLALEQADRGEREGRVELGELAEVAAVGGHRPQVLEAVALAFEHDARAVGREAAARLDRGVRGQAHRVAAGRGRAPEVAAPGEHDRRAVGRQRWIPRQVDHRRGRGRGGEQEAGGRGREGESAVDHVFPCGWPGPWRRGGRQFTRCRGPICRRRCGLCGQVRRKIEPSPNSGRLSADSHGTASPTRRSMRTHQRVAHLKA